MAASSFNYPDVDNLSLYFTRNSEVHGAATAGLEHLRALLGRGRETLDSAIQKKIYTEVLARLHKEGWICPIAHVPEYAVARKTKIVPGSIYSSGPHPFFEELRAVSAQIAS